MEGDPFKEQHARAEERHEQFFASNTLAVEGEEIEFGTFSPAASPEVNLFRAEFETPSGTVHIHPVSIQKSQGQVSVQYLNESDDGGWGQTETLDQEHDALPESTVGYAVYVYYDTFSSWEPWLACLSNQYSSALAIGIWLTHSPGNNTIEETHDALTGDTGDPMIPDTNQNDVLQSFGSTGDQCAITGNTENLRQAMLPYYVLPYLTTDTEDSLETYTGVPRFPFVIPALKIQVDSELYDDYACLRDRSRLKRQEEGVYAFDDDLRTLVDEIELSATAVTYRNWL